MVFIIFLLGVTLFINVAVGALAYLAIRESQMARNEVAQCHRALADILGQLTYIREQTPFSPVFRTEKPAPTDYFSVIMNNALANYDAQQAA